MSLTDKLVLITGAARRVGREIALSVAQAGGNVVVHYGQSQGEAEALQAEIQSLGRKVFLLKADLNDPTQVDHLILRASEHGVLYGLVNNAAIFESLSWERTSREAWEHHMRINLTVPFMLSQAFARQVPEAGSGRIINLLDWRALRPGADHLPYTTSKAALAALTRSLAIALAPRITVNGLALGAVLPPEGGKVPENILSNVPAKRWAELHEVGEAALFLLDGPAYITGEILHIDGGRHLV